LSSYELANPYTKCLTHRTLDVTAYCFIFALLPFSSHCFAKFYSFRVPLSYHTSAESTENKMTLLVAVQQCNRSFLAAVDQDGEASDDLNM
jgi:hypothetical protein